LLIACWSSKGGAGATVVASGLALALARSGPLGALLVDLAGDVPAALGMAGDCGAGVLDWLATDGAQPSALSRLERAASPGLGVLPAGEADPSAAVRPERTAALTAALAADPRAVVVDCGTIGQGARGAGIAVAAEASRSLLVIRPCFLALRRAHAAPVRPSGIVLVREEGRVLGRRDVEDTLGVPVLAELDVEPSIARAVDAGLLGARVPRALVRVAQAAGVAA
jgi:hypothetical protein